jgi:hypothetical protein
MGMAVSDMPEADKRAAEIGVSLMRDDAKFRGVVVGMLAARQMYVVALHELERLVAGASLPEVDGVDPAVMRGALEAFVMDAVASRAAQAFDSRVLLAGLSDVVLPWLQAVTKQHTEIEDAAVAAERAKAEKARLATVVLVCPGPGEPISSHVRGTTRLFFGKRALLQQRQSDLLSQIVDRREPSNPRQTVWFRDNGLVSPTRLEMASWLTSVAIKDWRKTGGTTGTLNVVWTGKVIPTLSAMPDLIVVDSLAAMLPNMPRDVGLYNVWEALHQVHKLLRAKAKDCGSVLFLFLAEEDVRDLLSVDGIRISDVQLRSSLVSSDLGRFSEVVCLG